MSAASLWSGRYREQQNNGKDKKVMRRSILVSSFFTVLVLVTSAAMAQEGEHRNEVSALGIGFFTKDSQGNGISQHSTDTGGLLVGYRFYFNRWLGADASYGHARNTQQNTTSDGAFNVYSNIHQTTGALVLGVPLSSARLKPYGLAGIGALTFDPTGNFGGFVPGADTQTKAAFVYGGGVDFRISDFISLRAEYRGLVYKRPDFDVGSLNSDVTTHTAQPSAGIVFRF
jgi:opacity protein-like surface antigen